MFDYVEHNCRVEQLTHTLWKCANECGRDHIPSKTSPGIIGRACSRLNAGRVPATLLGNGQEESVRGVKLEKPSTVCEPFKLVKDLAGLPRHPSFSAILFE